MAKQRTPEEIKRLYTTAWNLSDGINARYSFSVSADKPTKPISKRAIHKHYRMLDLANRRVLERDGYFKHHLSYGRESKPAEVWYSSRYQKAVQNFKKQVRPRKGVDIPVT
jgi:hypothetical protein